MGKRNFIPEITLKMFFRSDHWPCAGRPFVPNWGIHSPLRGLFVIKGAIVRGNENSLDNEFKSDAVEAFKKWQESFE